MVIQLILAFLAPVILSLLITPWVIRLALHVGAVDKPDERKTHARPVPRIGGLAVFFSFFLSLSLLLILAPDMLAHWWIGGTKGLVLFVCLTLVVALGIWDDLLTLRPLQKVVVEILLGTAVYMAGFRISNITNPFGFGSLELGIFDYLVTLVWIVGVTNALNLIDGLDGLAPGVAVIASLTVSAVAFMRGDSGTAIIGLLLSGAVVGFLWYNFNPAKIFLGDSGSLFLGFTLAVLAIQSSTKASAAFSLLVPVLALGLPIVDTLLSMTRRFLRWFLPHQKTADSKSKIMKSIFMPDNGHIHHRLIARGFSHRKSVLLLYLVSCALGAGALTVTLANNFARGIVLSLIGVATVFGIRQLRYKEINILSNGVLLPVFDLKLFNNDHFMVALDVVFILGSFLCAHLLSSGLSIVTGMMRPDLVALLIATTIQFAVFSSVGIYRITVKQFGFVDALKATKSVFIAVLLSGAVLALLPRTLVVMNPATVIIDFYFLASLVVGSRVSFRMLRTFFHRESSSGRRVLIYGADDHGMHALRRLYEGALPDITPDGFLDDNPALEKKQLYGLPVYGGHWKLEYLVRTRGIQELLLSSDNIRPEVLRRLKESARSLGIAVRRFNVSLEDVTLETSRTHPRFTPHVVARSEQLEPAPHREAKAS